MKHLLCVGNELANEIEVIFFAGEGLVLVERSPLVVVFAPPPPPCHTPPPTPSPSSPTDSQPDNNTHTYVEEPAHSTAVIGITEQRTKNSEIIVKYVDL